MLLTGTIRSLLCFQLVNAETMSGNECQIGSAEDKIYLTMKAMSQQYRQATVQEGMP